MAKQMRVAAEGLMASAPLAVDSVLVISTVTEPGTAQGSLPSLDDGATSVVLTEEGAPEHGTVSIASVGEETLYFYTPDAGYEGADGFTYAVTNAEGETATATVSITVAAEAPLVIEGTPGADTLIGGTGDNRISGGAGDDFIVGGEGADTVLAGSGDDFVDLRTLDPGDLMFGGRGIDVLSIPSPQGPSATGLRVSIVGGEVVVDGADVGGGFEQLSFSGGAGDDTARGGSLEDVLLGNDGDDVLIGGAGDDILFGANGGDVLSDGAGRGDLEGGAGNDRLTGGSGDDFLAGDDGVDRLAGGSGDDTLTGGNGTDLLSGGSGSDELTGGRGADEFLFQTSDGVGQDTITDFEVGVDALLLRDVAIDALVEAELDGTGSLDTLVTLSSGATIALLGVTGVTADDLI